MMDMDALAARVKARREAAGIGLNVRFQHEDGTFDEYSFATRERANSFRSGLIRQGLKVFS